MDWFVKGNWVLVDQETVDRFLLGGQGPFKIAESDDGWVLIEATDKYGTRFQPLPWVRVHRCTAATGPDATLLEKERAAMARESWRARRDANLTEMFKPKPRDVS